ncbi:hypothetical protein EW146_g1443 [Bondarzewia mesenterica]|uniref:RING-type domain-containing protein n=1 Tax=Bondarzewia mesenterica TaxID=1095465 RepID=A0A4S4M9Y9_9AGAM|nr:hypothetical protein EW146_g1443 [Bondarzewia mesenterica]
MSYLKVSQNLLRAANATRFTSCSLSKRGLATVAPDDSLRIPLIDFSKYRQATSLSEKRKVADEVVNGFKDVGFIYLEGHGIPDATLSIGRQSADFFRLPTEAKLKLSWEDPRSNRGYVRVGRERTTQSADPVEIAKLRATAPDSKESMEIGRDWDKTWKNQWPQESDTPGFKQTMLDFFQVFSLTCHNLHILVMRSIALGLDLEESYFDKKIDQQFHNLRLLSYPPIKTSLLQKEGQARAGAHSDYGSLTLLFQDSVGGLEVQNPHTKVFQPAKPIEGAIAINAGDLLARWSNDVLRSTLHRVVAPPAKKISDNEAVTPARQSIAFFCNPNGDANIEPSVCDVQLRDSVVYIFFGALHVFRLDQHHSLPQLTAHGLDIEHRCSFRLEKGLEYSRSTAHSIIMDGVDPLITLALSDLPTLAVDEVPNLDDYCAICLMTYRAIFEKAEEGESGMGVTKIEGCGHAFCMQDLSEWIRGRHGTCPTCRHPFLPDLRPVDSDDEASDDEDYLPTEYDADSDYETDLEDGFFDSDGVDLDVMDVDVVFAPGADANVEVRLNSEGEYSIEDEGGLPKRQDERP